MWEWLMFWGPIVFWVLMLSGLARSKWRERQHRRAWIEQTVRCDHCRGTGRHASWSAPAVERDAGLLSQDEEV